MSVLDVGSGSGDVSFLAAELVGEGGRVLGVDRSAAAVHRARARAIRRNHPNVTFIVGDPAAMQFDQPFDAIVGRFVLMYQDDPVWSLRRITKHLRANRLVVFQELHSGACRSCPAVSAFDEAARWLGEALRGSGARPELGLEMHSLFLDSGLPAPSMRADALVSGAAESPVHQLLAEAVRSLVPTLQRLNIASPAQIQIDSLADRIRKEVLARRAVVVSYGLVGAWARKLSLTTSACHWPVRKERTSPNLVTLLWDGQVVKAARTSCPILPTLRRCALLVSDISQVGRGKHLAR